MIEGLVELVWLEFCLGEVFTRGQDARQLPLGVAEVGLGFETVGVDGPLVVDAGGEALRSDLALVPFL